MFISRGLVLARIAGSTHLTSVASPIMLRTIDEGSALSASMSISSTGASADTSANGAGGVSSAENMNRAVEVDLVGTPHGWAVKAVAATKMVNREKRRSMLTMIR